MSSWQEYIERKLQQRKAQGALRRLNGEHVLEVDFSSNDYLGISRKYIDSQDFVLSGLGSSGSRLLNGDSVVFHDVEKQLAEFYEGEDALLFNSGYDANIGVLQALLDRHTLVLYDEYVHASIRDGIKMSDAKALKFRHNDIDHLDELLTNWDAERVLVVVESLYSMDGDRSDLESLVALRQKYGFELVVDEAHSTGLFGKRGEGLVCELGYVEDVMVRIHTFGKAIGFHGAVVICSQELKQYFVNFSRSLIYSTAMPESAVLTIKKLHDKMSKEFNNVHLIRSLSSLFKASLNTYVKGVEIVGQGPIFGIIIPGNDQVQMVAEYIQNKGFDVRAIKSPTVLKGRERIRIIMHSYNTYKEIEDFTLALMEALQSSKKSKS